MADNTTIAPASGGDVIATDDIGGVKYQRVKVAFGPDGTATDVSPAAGLPVQGIQDSRTAGTITTAASVVGPVAATSRNVMTVDVSGTYAGVTFVTEASSDGGVTYFAVQGVNNGTGLVASTWTPGTNASASYDLAVGAFTHFRVRATAYTSGTVAVGITGQVFAYEPTPAALTQGLAASGAPVLGAPVLVGGSDGTNARSLSTTTAGVLNVAADTELPAAAALADATANPTTPIVSAAAMLFNGTTWDRQRGNSFAATGDSGAKAANFLGAAQTNFNARGAYITLLVGAVSGTFTTFQTGLQYSFDGGTTWLPMTALGTNITTPASGNTIVWAVYPGLASQTPAGSGGTSAATQYNYVNAPLPRSWRFAMTLAGTSPSLTITSVNVQYIV